MGGLVSCAFLELLLFVLLLSCKHLLVCRVITLYCSLLHSVSLSTVKHTATMASVAEMPSFVFLLCDNILFQYGSALPSFWGEGLTFHAFLRGPSSWG